MDLRASKDGYYYAMKSDVVEGMDITAINRDKGNVDMLLGNVSTTFASYNLCLSKAAKIEDCSSNLFQYTSAVTDLSNVLLNTKSPIFSEMDMATNRVVPTDESLNAIYSDVLKKRSSLDQMNQELKGYNTGDSYLVQYNQVKYTHMLLTVAAVSMVYWLFSKINKK